MMSLILTKNNDHYRQFEYTLPPEDINIDEYLFYNMENKVFKPFEDLNQSIAKGNILIKCKDGKHVVLTNTNHNTKNLLSSIAISVLEIKNYINRMNCLHMHEWDNMYPLSCTVDNRFHFTSVFIDRLLKTQDQGIVPNVKCKKEITLPLNILFCENSQYDISRFLSECESFFNTNDKINGLKLTMNVLLQIFTKDLRFIMIISMHIAMETHI